MDHIEIKVLIPIQYLSLINQNLASNIEDAIGRAFEKKAKELQDRKLTRDEAAAKLKISLPTLQKFLKENNIVTQRVGNRILIPESGIENFLKNK
jgi:excisionase family DNA binding protein